MKKTGQKTILGASLGNCVHVAGILSFLNLAQQNGYKTQFLGPAVSLEKLIKAIDQSNPEIVALSYRLTPEVLEKLLRNLKEKIRDKKWQNKTFVFGGTPPAAKKAVESGLFHAVFTGKEPLEEVLAFLKGKMSEYRKGEIPPQTLVERISAKSPFPLLRHHFGLPSLKETVNGAQEIALSETLDVLSIGPDQNAQESFFRPKEMVKEHGGAGGVPLRKPEDLRAIFEATRCGNYPLLRCYSGTRDLIQWAEMLLETIHIAWGAVPLFWYSTLDGRSGRTPEKAIQENQLAIKWYGEHGIPLEVNESHHWSLRDAPDSVAVAAAFLAAYNAKEMGVSHYVAQYMFNTPASTSPPMDLAKMLAKKELIDSLEDESFQTICQTRTGLASLSSDPDTAKGQLAASTFYQLALEPQIVHVVGYCEADHAALPRDIIESVKIVDGVIQRYFMGPLFLKNNPEIMKRRKELIEEASLLLDAIQNLAPSKVPDPWTDPRTLAEAVRHGLLDAPHLCGNPDAAGRVVTLIREGACVAVDSETGKTLSEKERLTRIPGKKE